MVKVRRARRELGYVHLRGPPSTSSAWRGRGASCADGASMARRRPHTLELVHPRSLAALSGNLQRLVRRRLWLQVLVAMALGVGVGVLLGPSTGLLEPALAAAVGSWLALPGQLFLALVQMIVVPLVFASVIRGLAATDGLEQLKQLGTRVVAFFVLMTAAGILIGIGVGVLVEPGRFVDSEALLATLPEEVTSAERPAVQPPGLRELPQRLIMLLPQNPLSSAVSGEMLQVVLFAVIVGIALVLMAPDKSRPLLEVLGSLQEVCMTVVRVAMRLAPLAVFGLMAQITTRIGLDALLGMAVYVGTVLLGLGLIMVLYLVLVLAFTRRSPLWFLAATREVLLLAFSTSSSAAVMPLSIKTAEERLGARPSIAQFVIPIGATINMNGTALYQGVATMFLAQVFGVEIPLNGLVLLVLVAVGASIGSPATPGVGIVILSMVLSTVGIPPAGIALIMGVDRILDMSRTAVNVCGDLVATALMDRWVGGAVSAGEERAAEAAREARRAVHGVDVVVESPAR